MKTSVLSCLIDLSFQYDWYDRLRPYIDERNATAVGMVGTCWGSYLVTHVAAEDPIVKAGFSVHPSHVALMARLGESETAIYEGIQENGSAQYFGNTPSETNNTRPGGLADSIIDQVLYPLCAFDAVKIVALIQFYLRITTMNLSRRVTMVSLPAVTLAIPKWRHV